MEPPPRPVMMRSASLWRFAYLMAPTISGGASTPCTRTGSSRTFATGQRLRRTRMMSCTAAPAEEVMTAMRSG